MSGRTTLLGAVATGWNALALLWVVLVLANGPAVFEERPRDAAPAALLSDAPPARRALLVIVDGLRADTAADAALMPNLQRLAASGRRTTAHVPALVPSTIAGIRALVEGVVAPPAAFLEDFRAAPAHDGGLLRSVTQAGGATLVAGPPLWSDLYGRWIDRSITGELIAADDQELLNTVLSAGKERDWRLIVVHLGSPDTAAHVHGGSSDEYRRTVHWCDTALGKLIDAFGESAAIVVTSDHGVTARGGHAGPETAAISAPLICSGPGLPRALPVFVPQTHIPHLLAHTLSARLDARAKPLADAAAPSLPWPLRTIMALSAVAATLYLLASAAAGVESGRAALWLNFAFWGVVGVAVFYSRDVAFVAIPLVLFIVARAGRFGHPKLVLVALGLGAFVGARRISDALPTLADDTNGNASPITLIFLCVVTIALAALCAHLARDRARLGFFVPLVLLGLPPLLARFTGETVSLSSLDVRLAFHFMESALGLPGAAMAAALQPVLMTACVAAGVSWALRNAPRRHLKLLAAATAAGFAGQGVVAALTLGVGEHFGRQPLASLGLALLARQSGEFSTVFAIFAIFAAFRRKIGKAQPQPIMR